MRQKPTLSIVVVSAMFESPDDHVQAAVLLGVRVRFVAGVDDRTRASGSRRDALPDVFRALREAERRGLRSLQYLSGAADQLARDEERQQDIRNAENSPAARDEKVLVAAVRVSGRVGVVLEEIDVATNTLLGESRLGVDQQFFEHTLTGTVVIDQLDEAVALGRRVLRVRTHIQVTSGLRYGGRRWSCDPTTRHDGRGNEQPRRGSVSCARERCR